MDWLVNWNGKSFDAARSNEVAGKNRLGTFAHRIILNMNGLRGNEHANVIAGARASGCVQSLMRNPHEMDSKKGNVKERRKVLWPQVLEKIGSSAWTRTRNPPVNSRMLYH